MIKIVADDKNIKLALEVTPEKIETAAKDALTSFKDLAGSISNLSRAIATPPNLTGVGQAAGAFVKKSFQNVYGQLKQTRKVKLKALLNLSGSAFARTPEETLSIVATQLKEVLSTFAKTLESNLITDPDIRASINSLEEVQAVAQVVSDVMSLYYAVKNLGDKLEPFFPALEIVSNAASIFMTGGGVVPEMTSRAAQMAMQELKKLIPLLLYPLKEQILNREVDVPVILLGGLQRLQTEEAQKNWQSAEKFLTSIDAAYTTVTEQLTWAKTVNASASLIETEIINPYLKPIVNEIPKGALLIYRKDNAANYWMSPRLLAWSRTLFPRSIEFDDTEIISLSKELVESQDTSNAFYLDRQLHKMILEELKADGAILDIEKRTYDEKKTANSPRGDRAAFKEINDKITSYHNILRVLTGETRANLTEEIPVIDFYRKKQTSLKNVYLKTPTGQIDPTLIKAISDKNPLAPDAPTSSSLLQGENPSDCFINFALSQYDPRIHFYNTRSSIPRIPSVQVDYAPLGNDSYIMRASGLLNGLFTSPATYADNGMDIETWKWDLDEIEGYTNYQELAASYGMELPPGVKYSPAHLVGGLNSEGAGSTRTIIPKPLLDEDNLSEGWGLAQKYYEGLIDAVENQLVLANEVSYATWKTLGGFLEDVASPADKRVSQKTGETKTVKWEWSWEWFRLSGNRKVIREDVYSLVSDAVYGEKLDYFVEDENRFNPSIWGDKISGTTLILNIDSHPEDISISARYMPSITRFLGVNWETKRLSNETAWLDHPSRVFRVYLNGLTDISNTPIIEKIECIMPQELIRKKSTSVGILGSGRATQARLLIPNGPADEKRDNTLYLPNKMYLMSTTPLGFGLTSPLNLCTFYNEQAIFVMQVTAIDYIKSPLECENFQVVYEGNTYTYTAGVTPSNQYPTLSVEGSSCYIYTLIPKAITYESSNLSMNPAKYPNSFIELFTVPNGKVWPKATNDVVSMRGMDIAVGLPELASGAYKQFKRDNSSNSFEMMDYLSGNNDATRAVLKSVLREMLKDIPIITTEDVTVTNDNDVEETREVPDITLERMPEILKPLIDSYEDFKLLNDNNPDIDITNFVNRIGSIEFQDLYTTIKELIEDIDSDPNLEQLCIKLDQVLGNSAEPWISVGTGVNDHISESQLEQITTYIKTSLEGSESSEAPVRFLPGQAFVTGSPNSLYYQRYLFLNNRMHWTSGHLAQAAQRIMNWQDASSAMSLGQNRIEAYDGYINVVPAAEMGELEYFPEERDADGNVTMEGKFYFKEILQHIEDSIDDKCLLVCIPCPVAKTCPFFSRDKSIRTYVPAADSIELWLKDNQLNLLVYEQDNNKEYLDLKTSDGKLLDIQQYKDRQKVYTEIVKDDKTDFPLEKVRGKISSLIEGYHQGDSYLDDLGWLQGGRYGSLKKIKSNDYEASNYRYLYDAIFVRDEETEFTYTNSSKYYPVKVEQIEGTSDRAYEEPTIYEGNVRIKIPSNLKIFENAGPASDVYIVSDDTTDIEGKKVESVVYINNLENLQIAFDLSEDTPPATEKTGLVDIDEDPSPQDIAQWHVNTYKWLSEGYDQWWMSKVRKKAADYSGRNVTLEGRKRVTDVIDPLITETPDVNNVLNGKPIVNNYVNFLRKMRINLDCFKWVKGYSIDSEQIEIKKQILANMHTNVRLVVIKK